MTCEKGQFGGPLVSRDESMLNKGAAVVQKCATASLAGDRNARALRDGVYPGDLAFKGCIIL